MAKTATRRTRDGGYADGTLVLTDEAGTEVLVVPSEVAEQIRLLMGRIRSDGGMDLPEYIGVISALGGEGVTTVARSLGLVLSNDTGRTVCVVDLNFPSPGWWPSDTDTRAGLAEVIAAGAPLDAVLVATGSPGLSILPAGITAASERPLLANSQALDDTLEALRTRFDYVVLDLPAVAVTSDALTLAERSDGLLLVIDHGVTTESDVRAALDQLDGAPILGAVINQFSSRIPGFIRRRLPPS